MLFDPRTHEPLTDRAWSAAAAEAEIRAIAREADAALAGGTWWPLHPLDAEPGDPDVVHGIYFGAAGVLWALPRLAQVGLHEPGHDYARLAGELLESYLRRPEFDGPLPSVWMGEGGIALVAWLLAPTPALADRVERAVATEPPDDSVELMWGSPGLLLIADAMLERTGEQRWAQAWSRIAERLVLSRGERVAGFWTQRLAGRTREIIGPAHGLAGTVAALAGRPELLAPERFVPSAVAAIAATAIREGEHANWPPELEDSLAEDDGSIRTQWCHGAP